jgi:hypothetical protein
LRAATSQQNKWNSIKAGRLLPPGINRGHKSKRYIVQISHNNQLISLGTFDTVEEARAVYLSFVRPLRGEFFPE